VTLGFLVLRNSPATQAGFLSIRIWSQSPLVRPVIETLSPADNMSITGKCLPAPLRTFSASVAYLVPIAFGATVTAGLGAAALALGEAGGLREVGRLVGRTDGRGVVRSRLVAEF
jgi:hypothetical protein